MHPRRLIHDQVGGWTDTSETVLGLAGGATISLSVCEPGIQAGFRSYRQGHDEMPVESRTRATFMDNRRRRFGGCASVPCIRSGRPTLSSSGIMSGTLIGLFSSDSLAIYLAGRIPSPTAVESGSTYTGDCHSGPGAVGPCTGSVDDE